MKHLYLSSTNKKLAGLCGGIGEYFGMDPTLVRLLWVVVTLCTGLVPGVIAYIVGALIVPEAPTTKKAEKS